MNPPPAIVERYPALSGSQSHFLGNRGGYSGAQLWRMATPAGDFCLKAWQADGIVLDRLIWIHQMLAAAHGAGVDFVPQARATRAGSTVVEHEGRLWDCSTWLPGIADFHQDPSNARLQAGASALARLHRAWQKLHARIGPVRVVERRLATLHRWQTMVASGWKPVIAAEDPVHASAERAWLLLPSAVPQAQRALTAWRDVPLPLHACWCDPWHDHVLFVGERVSGLIDHGAVKEDHAAIDLARMLGSFVGNDRAAWDIALAAYRAIRPLSEQECVLIAVLEQTGLVNALVAWLRWLYHDRRVFEDRAAIAKRLQAMVARLDNQHVLEKPGA